MENTPIKVKLTKLTELPDALHPNNIPEGAVHKGWMRTKPTLNERFYVYSEGYTNFSTSGVQEIISEDETQITFKTYSSIYQLTYLHEDTSNK